MVEMVFGPAFWLAAALGVAGAAAYGLLLLRRPPSLLRALVKTLFMGAFTAALVFAHAPVLLITAIAASALGDFFLAFDKKQLLPLGILSFLIAQLLYVVIFGEIWFVAGEDEPLLPRHIATGAVIAAALGVLIWMAPKLGWMAVAVVPYAVAITTMGAAAMWLPWKGWPAMLGALSFLVSDFVLAAELFRLPADAKVRRLTAPVVWWTYAAAQVLIVWGVTRLAGTY